MQIAFRADASPRIGTGHFVRCLTLADEARLRGAQTCFVSRDPPDFLREMARARGHEVVPLDAATDAGSGDLAHSDWLAVSQNTDACETAAALERRARVCDWIIVDHYALDHRWEIPMRERARRLFVIDDLADRYHSCELLMDQNLHVDMSSRYCDKVDKGCILLLGPDYALLRREFRVRRAALRQRTDVVDRILIFMGGVDTGNHTGAAIEAVLVGGFQHLAIDVIVGAQNPNRDPIAARCGQLGFAFHVQAANMAELIGAADLGIGAAGSASWERCCLGLPTICLSIASNQTSIARGLESRGAIVWVGRDAHDPVGEISEALISLINQPNKLRAMSSAAAALVDGAGAERVCNRLFGET
jgi:UDP-2,4-diacetamido-2,4,6-trideoxy-beta-L-altropyranose hydrolase